MKSELHVPSDLKFLTIVENWLVGCLEVQFKGSVDWSKQSSRLRLVLVEAYSNVVRHAHKDQPLLPVLIRLELKDQEIALEVWDHGKGFDLSDYSPPNPTDQQEGGYGWLIMHRLMDNVEYQLQVEGGNCLKLEVTLPKITTTA
ncbi:MAG: ATP-binding protein [Brasilonema octagenarum HA4186-MV1]|jgi:serine/threonine-protein kinase RsbW|uniref:Anti-sigma factor n=2 Tax=Brasilonema TaxID=383614 RepID=A0A856M5Y8_9CYAN|nr:MULTISPECIES: anti-sigma regulatory factor [Brasilonema]MBW4627207.1 ATP-binding protein [Brasilonema octagenarum HA4186-MV1]NMF64180.1 anti-sigma factor [Brasilonema octagenarum UFV-OR1]QDL06595.1 anti-sigma factor [Brasilonema sennae CENA114]QDL12965.1 anti-sigma factor [Brasilonema octagenarum UFV-E1]